MDDELESLDLNAKQAKIPPPAPINEGAQKVLDFMGAKQPPGPEDVGDLEYKELCPELVEEYAAIKVKMAALKDIHDGLRANILKCADAESRSEKKWAVKVGNRTLTFTRTAGQVDFSYEQYIRDQIGEKAAEEVQQIIKGVKDGVVTSPYTTRGKGSIKLEVI